eukprot:CAMPEP_0194671062 /NCGR_PEP_ID=MMETSP0295-20121207/5584_1 /TAXON_ID=39354 /ORGANISM="Heterosigma akashiwo, Strain CCMP2393" /LENGTH=392 /DNA_ID=CAMNT_0039554425 /DNA_START=34 /DNA_END=1213 /DNA_ORIENTATION=-
MAWIINAKAAQNLRNYKYVGSDNSLLYKYLLSPFAQYCVDTFVPSWMAPNVITLMGLLIEVFTLCVVMFYCPQFAGDENTPRWIYLLIAASLLTYQTLDNMDGKQARKTGSSSPLGLIFDHGCDAVNAGGPAELHALRDPRRRHRRRAPGLLADERALLLGHLGGVPPARPRAALGQRAQRGRLRRGPLRHLDLLCGADLVAPDHLRGAPLPGPPAGLRVRVDHHHCRANCQRVQARRQGGPEQAGGNPPGAVGPPAFRFLVYLGCAWLRDNPDLMARCPHLALALLFQLTAEAEIALMVAHCSGTRFTCWRPVLTPLAALWANTGIFKSPPVDPFYALLAYFIAASIYFAFFVSRVVIEVKDALGIHAFSIKPRLPKTKQGAPLEEKAKAD